MHQATIRNLTTEPYRQAAQIERKSRSTWLFLWREISGERLVFLVGLRRNSALLVTCTPPSSEAWKASLRDDTRPQEYIPLRQTIWEGAPLAVADMLWS